MLRHLQVLKPGLDPGAARVFLEFLSYSSGPLPEGQFAKVKVGREVHCCVCAARGHIGITPASCCLASCSWRPCGCVKSV